MILSHARLPIPTLPQVQRQENLGCLVANSIDSCPGGTSPNTVSFYQMTLQKFVGSSKAPTASLNGLSLVTVVNEIGSSELRLPELPRIGYADAHGGTMTVKAIVRLRLYLMSKRSNCCRNILWLGMVACR